MTDPKCRCGHGVYQHDTVPESLKRMFPGSWPAGRSFCRRRGCGCGTYKAKP